MNILEKYSLEISVTSFWVTFLFLGPFLIATNNLAAFMETGIINWIIALLVSLIVSYIVVRWTKNTKIEKYVAIFFSVALMVAWILNTGIADSMFFEKNFLLNKLFKLSIILVPTTILSFILSRNKKLVCLISCLFMFMQISGVLANLYQYNDKITESKKYSYDKKQWEEFAEENIVVFIVDTFASPFTAEAIEQDDIATLLKDFTYYPEYLATDNFTHVAIHSLFSGKMNEQTFKPALNNFNKISLENSVLKILKENNYSVDVLTFASRDFFGEFPSNVTYDDSEKISSPTSNFMGAYFQYFNKFMFGKIKAELNMYQAINTAIADKYLFDLTLDKRLEKGRAVKIIHFWGIHTPVLFDEKDNLTTFYQRVMEDDLETRRTIGIFKSIGKFLEELKKNNIYDNTTIIIVGDHGIPSNNLNTKSKVFEKTKMDFEKFDALMLRANTTLLIKPVNITNQNININYKRVSGFDIAKTIADIAKMDNDFGGYNILESEKIPEDRTRYFFYHKISNDVPVKKYSVSGSVGDASGWKLEEEF